MVRYEKDLTLARLNERIDAVKASWRSRARERVETFRIAKKYNESSGIWSEIKSVYMQLQANKCAFCERELESEEFGKIEHDVEHYRPKRNAKGWPSPKIRRERNISFDFPTGDDLSDGYYLLAYHPLNYITSCKTCNSVLKGDFFPIAGDRVKRKDEPKDYASEMAYLFYPIGAGDIDPESALTFEGIIPVPVNKSGKKRKRALVTIAFFELATREALLVQRARRLVAFARAYQDSIEGRTAARRERGAKDVERMTRISAPHANCVRSFHRHCLEKPEHAEVILDLVYDYLDSIESPNQ